MKKKEYEKIKKRADRLQNIVDSMSRRKREYSIGQAKYDTLRFAVIGDTHIGNLYERIDALNEFYKTLKQEKINTVFHCGDVLDGHHVYRGQEYEQYAVGFDKQLEAIVQRYPKTIKTFFITGNHDASYKNINGMNVGKIIDKYVENMNFLDQDIATVIMKTKSGKKVKYRLMHPSGGTAYAVSYKSQKIVESFSGGDKPRALFIGHYHKADMMPMFRNVKAFQVGCFCSQTPFMLKKPTPAHVGGWIIEDKIGKKGTSRIKSEFISFYEPQEFKEIK